jgi:hypothetical protein
MEIDTTFFQHLGNPLLIHVIDQYDEQAIVPPTITIYKARTLLPQSNVFGFCKVPCGLMTDRKHFSVIFDV